MLVDGIAARLRHRNDEMGRALIYYYGRDISYATLGRIMQISKTRAESLVKSAEQWVDGALDEKIAA
jgi:DNA-directed RNA polymerase specialized sigma24 family protein